MNYAHEMNSDEEFDVSKERFFCLRKLEKCKLFFFLLHQTLVNYIRIQDRKKTKNGFALHHNHRSIWSIEKEKNRCYEIDYDE